MIRRRTWCAALMAGTLTALATGCDSPTSNESVSDAGMHYPIQIALAAMGENFQGSVSNLYVTQRVDGGEVPDKAEVTVEESGLLDDSIEAEKTVFSLQLKGGKWAITERVKTQRCRADRGHQDFSDQNCQ